MSDYYERRDRESYEHRLSGNRNPSTRMSFKRLEDAQRRAETLREQGYHPTIVKSGDRYKIRLGGA